VYLRKGLLTESRRKEDGQLRGQDEKKKPSIKRGGALCSRRGLSGKSIMWRMIETILDGASQHENSQESASGEGRKPGGEERTKEDVTERGHPSRIKRSEGFGGAGDKVPSELRGTFPPNHTSPEKLYLSSVCERGERQGDTRV